VAAGADFVVEGAIDLVLLGTEDGGEVVGHDGGVVCGVVKRFGSGGRGRRLCVRSDVLSRCGLTFCKVQRALTRR
jgi:hypothetical protein